MQILCVFDEYNSLTVNDEYTRRARKVILKIINYNLLLELNFFLGGGDFSRRESRKPKKGQRRLLIFKTENFLLYHKFLTRLLKLRGACAVSLRKVPVCQSRQTSYTVDEYDIGATC